MHKLKKHIYIPVRWMLVLCLFSRRSGWLAQCLQSSLGLSSPFIVTLTDLIIYKYWRSWWTAIKWSPSCMNASHPFIAWWRNSAPGVFLEPTTSSSVYHLLLTTGCPDPTGLHPSFNLWLLICSVLSPFITIVSKLRVHRLSLKRDSKYMTFNA